MPSQCRGHGVGDLTLAATEPDALLALLGCSVDNPDFLRVKSGMIGKEDCFDPERSYLNTTDGVLSVGIRSGVYFDTWWQCEPDQRERLLVRLPDGIEWSDSRDQVQRKLGKPKRYRPATSNSALGYMSEGLIYDRKGMRKGMRVVVEFERSQVSLVYCGLFEQ